MACLIAVNAHAAEQELKAQINALQRERVETLTKLVEVYSSQYSAGTIMCETAVGAELDLVNAQLGATDRPEAKIALLMEDLRRQRATRMAVEHSDTPSLESQVLWWQSICLYTEINLRREQKGAASQIKSLREQRTEALTKLLPILLAQYGVGTVSGDGVILAEAALVSSHSDVTDKPDSRIALLAGDVKREAEFLKTAQQRLNNRTVVEMDAVRLKSLLSATKIRLFREQSRQEDTAAQVKAAQKEREEALTANLKITESRYSAKAIGYIPVLDAKAELINTWLEETDKPEKRVALLTELEKGAAERLEIVKSEYKLCFMSEGDLLRARSLLLAAKIGLLRERSSQIRRTGNTDSRAK
jgi:hypothetical protein